MLKGCATTRSILKNDRERGRETIRSIAREKKRRKQKKTTPTEKKRKKKEMGISSGIVALFIICGQEERTEKSDAIRSGRRLGRGGLF